MYTERKSNILNVFYFSDESTLIHPPHTLYINVFFWCFFNAECFNASKYRTAAAAIIIIIIIIIIIMITIMVKD